MPAIMIFRRLDDPDADAPGDWRAGEIVANVDIDHRFAFREMPVNVQGSFTVDQVNAFTEANIALYAGVTMLDSGTITLGAQGPLPVIASDVIVWQFNTGGNYWVNFGPRTDVPDSFGHLRVEDKTLAEVLAYLERYNKKLDFASLQYNPATEERRARVTNIRVSSSGNNGFSAQGISEFIDAWNGDFPDNTIALFDTDNLTYYTVDGVLPPEVYVDFVDYSNELARTDFFRRRRWYITQQGLGIIGDNDWIFSGTAAEINPWLRDGLLD